MEQENFNVIQQEVEQVTRFQQVANLHPLRRLVVGFASLVGLSVMTGVVDVQAQNSMPGIEHTIDFNGLHTESFQELPTPVAGSLTDFYEQPGVTTAINFTVTETKGPGYFQLRNNSDAIGSFSNNNASSANQTVASLSFVQPNMADGKMQIYSQSGGHEVIDDQGTFTAGAYEALNPVQRVFDSRNTAPVLPARSITVIHGRPYSTAVANLTTTDVVAPGFIEVMTDPAEIPGAHSNANATPGYTTPMLTTLPFNKDGETYIFNQQPLSLAVDIQGYLAPSAIDDVPDQRLLDTRNSSGVPLGAGTITTIHGRPNSTAWISLLADNSKAPNFVQVLGQGQTPGTASNLNTNPGQVVGNSVLATFDANGNDKIFNQSPTDLIADLQLYFTSGAYKPKVPFRTRDTRDGTEVIPGVPQYQPDAGCNKVATIEQDFTDTSHTQTKYEVNIYDDKTGIVAQYPLSNLASANVPHAIHIDPIKCEDPSIVYASFSASLGRSTLHERNLSSGAISDLVVPGSGNFDQPAPQMNPGVLYYRSGTSNINTIRFTPNDNVISENVDEFTISDLGTTFAELQSHFSDGTFTQTAKTLTVVRYSDTSRQLQKKFTYTFPKGGNEGMNNLRVAPDNSRLFVLHSTDGKPGKIQEILQSGTDPTLATFTPVQFTGSNDSTITVKDFQVASSSTIIANVVVTDPITNTVTFKTIKIDLTSGAIKTLVPVLGVDLVDVSM